VFERHQTVDQEHQHHHAAGGEVDDVLRDAGFAVLQHGLQALVCHAAKGALRLDRLAAFFEEGAGVTHEHAGPQRELDGVGKVGVVLLNVLPAFRGGFTCALERFQPVLDLAGQRNEAIALATDANGFGDGFRRRACVRPRQQPRAFGADQVRAFHQRQHAFDHDIHQEGAACIGVEQKLRGLCREGDHANQARDLVGMPRKDGSAQIGRGVAFDQFLQRLVHGQPVVGQAQFRMGGDIAVQSLDGGGQLLAGGVAPLLQRAFASKDEVRLPTVLLGEGHHVGNAVHHRQASQLLLGVQALLPKALRHQQDHGQHGQDQQRCHREKLDRHRQALHKRDARPEKAAW